MHIFDTCYGTQLFRMRLLGYKGARECASLRRPVRFDQSHERLTSTVVAHILDDEMLKSRPILLVEAGVSIRDRCP
jgi:hypothetical protein